MENSQTAIEDSIRALESALHISITIVDNAGIFHTPQGAAIFSRERQSHQKNAVCAAGFCEKCIEHCRYKMNAKCQRERSVFVETCWKGITEIVVPLFNDGVHYGMLFAGSWKSDAAPAQLSAEFADAYGVLPRWDGTRTDLFSILPVFADGLVYRLKTMNALSVLPDSRGSRVMAYIRAHASEPIGLSDIAELLSLSRTRTSVLMRKLLGMSLPALIIEERIARAKVLLASSESTLANIAEMTGFCDEYHLSRTFSRAVKMSPREYRRMHRAAARL